jgi:hypothetical protein
MGAFVKPVHNGAKGVYLFFCLTGITKVIGLL